MALLKSKDLGMNIEDYQKIRQTCSVASVAGNLLFLENAKLDKTKIKQENTNQNLCMIRTVLDLGGSNAQTVLEKMKDTFEKDGKILGTDSESQQQNFSPSNLPKKQQLDIYNTCFLGTYQLNEIDLIGNLSEMDVEQVNESFSKCLQDNGVIVKTSPDQKSNFETTPIPEIKLDDIKLATTPPPPLKKKESNNALLFGGTVGSSLLVSSICCLCIILLVIVFTLKL